MMPPSTTATNDEIAPEYPPTIPEGAMPAPELTDGGAGTRADGDDTDRRPTDVAALTGDNGGGTSGNHGNGTAG
jgi:hypothetical protein